ncbi:MAG TPA: hypothetical protein VGB67_13115 [Fibrella sp.]|jgi:pyruvate/2-oxoacid:ferredoxin oxidoreductase alpha subunit
MTKQDKRKLEAALKKIEAALAKLPDPFPHEEIESLLASFATGVHLIDAEIKKAGQS